MKKFWQQINRGLVLLFAVVIGVTIYLIVDSQNKKKQRDELIKLSTMFISDSSRLYEFPEDIDFWDRSNIKQDALLPALYQNATPIYHYFCDNEEARKSQIESTYNFMYTSYFEERCPVSCERTITGIEVKEIYRDSATITINTSTTIEYEDESGKRTSEQYHTYDTLQFLYQDGQWKIISMSCPLNDDGMYYGAY